MGANTMTKTERAMTPGMRITKGLCPECGEALADLDVLAHRDHHWPRRLPDDPAFDKPHVLYRMLTLYAREHASDQAPASNRIRRI